ncbi:hypothetical protein D3C76_1365950 [compost metagenome]
MLRGFWLFYGIDDTTLSANHGPLRFGAEEVEQDKPANTAAALVDWNAILTIQGEVEAPFGFFLEAWSKFVCQLRSHFPQLIEGAGGDIHHTGLDLLLQCADLILERCLSFLDCLLQWVLGFSVPVVAFTVCFEQGKRRQKILNPVPDGFVVCRNTFAHIKQSFLSSNRFCPSTNSLPPK